MSSTRDFAESVIFRLGAYGAASARRMFGGFGVFVDGAMIGLIADDVLYLKADDTNRGDFVDAGMGPFTYDRKGRPARMSYWRVPDAIAEDPEALALWAAKAHEAARSARAKRGRSKRK